jgi:hypothetical protein
MEIRAICKIESYNRGYQKNRSYGIMLEKDLPEAVWT